MKFTTKDNRNYKTRRKQLVNMINMNGPDYLVYKFATNMLESMFGFSVIRLCCHILWDAFLQRWWCFKARFKKNELDKFFEELERK